MPVARMSAGAGRILLTRGLRGFADGLVSVLLAGHLARLGFSSLQIGAIVAAASANVLQPYAAVARLARMRARAWPPRTRRGQALIGGAALALGLLLIAEPTLVLDLLVVCGGALLAYFGTGELLTAVGVAPEHERLSLSRSRGGIAAIAVSLGALVGGASDLARLHASGELAKLLA